MVGLHIVIAVCVLVNAAGVAAAALVVHRRARVAGPRLLSFAVGVLLGVVLLDVLPHLWESIGNTAALVVLFGTALLVGLVFDRLCICSHLPSSRRAVDVDRGGAQVRPAVRGSEVLLGADFVHSLVDGALITGALAVGVVPGAVTAMAVAMHEVPRRIATVALLVGAGYRPALALTVAVGAGMGTALGGGLAWFLAETIRPALPVALALSAATMLYVALGHSALLLGARRGRVAAIECGVPLLAGVLSVGGSHHLLALAGAHL
jgi:zinc and cadmium transporter